MSRRRSRSRPARRARRSSAASTPARGDRARRPRPPRRWRTASTSSRRGPRIRPGTSTPLQRRAASAWTPRRLRRPSTAARLARRAIRHRHSRSRPTRRARASSAGSTRGAWASCSSAHTTVSLADGAHTFEVRATDPAGNVDATPPSRGFTVDTAAPNTTIDSGPSGPTNDATPTFAFSADQAGSTFECRVDAGAWASCSSAHTTAALADGAHTSRSARPIRPATSTRLRRHAASPSTPLLRTPRSTAARPARPAIRRRHSPSRPARRARPSSAGSTAAHGARARRPRPPASLADGAHTFEVRATDPAGNVDPTPASRAFTVDTAAPDTTIDSGPSGPTNDATPTFTFSSDQPGSTFECRTDAGAWASCSSAHTTASLGDGPHTFEVRAIDSAGNTDPTPAHAQPSPSTPARPTPRSTRVRPVPTNDPTPTFGFSADELGTTFECRVDGGPWGACSTPGDHRVARATARTPSRCARPTRPATSTPTPASRSFTVDTAAPRHDYRQRPVGPHERCDADVRLLG